MKTAFVVAGRPPAWVTDQTRYVAQRLTDDGRVLVSFTDGFDPEIQLPGNAGGSTLLGIAPNGYPLWTGRLSAALGLRRRHGAAVLVLFDDARINVMLLAAIVARLRRERVILHDLCSRAEPTASRRLARKLLDRTADRTVKIRRGPTGRNKSVVLATCDDDREFMQLVIAAAMSMPAETAASWRMVIHSHDPDARAIVAEADRDDVLSCEDGLLTDDLLMASDVIVSPYGFEKRRSIPITDLGAAAVIVGHPVAHRMTRRFDGTWLSRTDVSSLLVALESARGSLGGHGRSAADMRVEADRVVAAVRLDALQDT